MGVSVAVSHRLFLKRQKDAANITRRAELLDDLTVVLERISATTETVPLPIRRELDEDIDEATKLVNQVLETDKP